MLFLMSESNVYDTWSDVEKMGENLVEEVAEYVANMVRPPTRIRYVHNNITFECSFIVPWDLIIRVASLLLAICLCPFSVLIPEKCYPNFSLFSFIAHSLGGIIVRAAVGRPDADWLRAKTHTLLTLNSPHLGLPYGARVSTWGVALVQWWKKSRYPVFVFQYTQWFLSLSADAMLPDSTKVGEASC